MDATKDQKSLTFPSWPLTGFVGVSPFDVNPPLFDMHATTKCNTITFMPIFPGKIVGLINWDQLTTMA